MQKLCNYGGSIWYLYNFVTLTGLLNNCDKQFQNVLSFSWYLAKRCERYFASSMSSLEYPPKR